MFGKLYDMLHDEINAIEDKLADGKTNMSSQDLEEIDKIAHALKCLATYEAMQGASERQSRGRYYDTYSSRRY